MSDQFNQLPQGNQDNQFNPNATYVPREERGQNPAEPADYRQFDTDELPKIVTVRGDESNIHNEPVSDDRISIRNHPDSIETPNDLTSLLGSGEGEADSDKPTNDSATTNHGKNEANAEGAYAEEANDSQDEDEATPKKRMSRRNRIVATVAGTATAIAALVVGVAVSNSSPDKDLKASSVTNEEAPVNEKAPVTLKGLNSFPTQEQIDIASKSVVLEGNPSNNPNIVKQAVEALVERENTHLNSGSLKEPGGYTDWAEFFEQETQESKELGAALVTAEYGAGKKSQSAQDVIDFQNKARLQIANYRQLSEAAKAAGAVRPDFVFEYNLKSVDNITSKENVEGIIFTVTATVQLSSTIEELGLSKDSNAYMDHTGQRTYAILIATNNATSSDVTCLGTKA